MSNIGDKELRCYLAGGMRTGWRLEVQLQCEWMRFLKPDQTMRDPDEFTTHDLLCIKHCDIVLAYMEEDNPSGIGLAAEVGYAKGLGKTVIFVDMKHDRYFEFIRSMADVVFTDLDHAIKYLARLQTIR